ncbi:MAG: sulfotransferase family protein [Egibacteraceae bacterium]
MHLAQPRLPNLIIAGVSKAGTSSLFRYLAQHPDICPSDIKELRYFSPYRFDGPVQPLSQYAQHFHHCDCEHYVMEATPGYFYGGAPLVEAIIDTLDDAHVLVSLRDPVDRLWSYYRHCRSHLRFDKDLTLDEYLETCQRLREEGTDRMRDNMRYWGLSGGFYADFITPWWDALGDRFQVVFFEDLVRNTTSTVMTICEWLGIDPTAAEDFDYSVTNSTVVYRSKTVQRVALALVMNGRSKLLSGRHPKLKRMLRGAYYAVNRDRRADPGLGTAAREQLQAIFAPANAQLATKLQQRGYTTMPEWLAAVRWS